MTNIRRAHDIMAAHDDNRHPCPEISLSRIGAIAPDSSLALETVRLKVERRPIFWLQIWRRCFRGYLEQRNNKSRCYGVELIFLRQGFQEKRPRWAENTNYFTKHFLTRQSQEQNTLFSFFAQVLRKQQSGKSAKYDFLLVWERRNPGLRHQPFPQ